MAPNLGSIVSSGLTAGVLIGFATGFVYMVLQGIRWARSIRDSLTADYEEIIPPSTKDNWCYYCGRGPEHDRFDKYIIEKCTECNGNVCNLCCARTPSGRLCGKCIRKRDKDLSGGDWIFKEIRERFRTTVAAIRGPKEKDDDVRDMVEKVTEKMVGGSLDNVRVTNLNSHPSYMGFMDRYQGVLSLTLSRLSAAVRVIVEGSSTKKQLVPKNVHVQLKELIREIIHDANKLPIFTGHQRNGRIEDISTKTYEEILATAILNKIVEKFQFSPKTEDDLTLEMKRLESSDNETYLSSEEYHDDDDSSSFTHSHMTTDFFPFTKENELNGATIYTSEEDGDDINIGVKVEKDTEFKSDGGWEENWLFLKKKIKNNATASVVSSTRMLVPNPNIEVKAQIGDTDADETSNFSDCSESELVQVMDSDYKSIYKSTSNYNSKPKTDTTTYNGSLSSEGPHLIPSEPRVVPEKYDVIDFALSSLEDDKGIEQDTEYTISYEASEQLPSPDTSRKDSLETEPEIKEVTEAPVVKKETGPIFTEKPYPRDEGEKLDLPSVKLLAKQFTGKHNHHKVHSLTARNLSRGIQEELREINSPDPEIKTSPDPEEIVEPRLRVKKNINFWEQLAQKSK